MELDTFYLIRSGDLLTNINYTAIQTKKFKAQWNLIRSAGSQNISECIESKSPEQLQWWLTDKPYLHGMFLSNMSIINIKIFKWAALFVSKLCSNTTVRDKD